MHPEPQSSRMGQSAQSYHGPARRLHWTQAHQSLDDPGRRGTSPPSEGGSHRFDNAIAKFVVRGVRCQSTA